MDIFNTKDSKVIRSFDYSEQMTSPIKGLISYDMMRHVVIDQKGKMIIGGADESAQVASDNVSCLRGNPNMKGQVAIGSRDTLLQIWDINRIDQGNLW